MIWTLIAQIGVGSGTLRFDRAGDRIRVQAKGKNASHEFEFPKEDGIKLAMTILHSYHVQFITREEAERREWPAWVYDVFGDESP